MWRWVKISLLVLGVSMSVNAENPDEVLFKIDGDAIKFSECAPALIAKHTSPSGEVEYDKLIEDEVERRVVWDLLQKANINPSALLTVRVLKKAMEEAGEEEKKRIAQSLVGAGMSLADLIYQKSIDPEEQFKAACMVWIEQEFSNRVKVSDEEVYALYKSAPKGIFNVKSHSTAVGLAVSKESVDSAKIAQRILDLLVQGEGFDVIFKQYNNLTPNQLRQIMSSGEVVEKIRVLKPESPIELVELPNYWVIVKLALYSPSRELNYDEVKASLGQRLKEQKIRQLVNATVATQISKHKVEILERDKK